MKFVIDYKGNTIPLLKSWNTPMTIIENENYMIIVGIEKQKVIMEIIKNSDSCIDYYSIFSYNQINILQHLSGNIDIDVYIHPTVSRNVCFQNSEDLKWNKMSVYNHSKYFKLDLQDVGYYNKLEMFHI